MVHFLRGLIFWYTSVQLLGDENIRGVILLFPGRRQKNLTQTPRQLLGEENVPGVILFKVSSLGRCNSNYQEKRTYEEYCMRSEILLTQSHLRIYVSPVTKRGELTRGNISHTVCSPGKRISSQVFFEKFRIFQILPIDFRTVFYFTKYF